MNYIVFVVTISDFFLAGSRVTVKETIMKDLSNDLVISNNMLRLLDCVGQGT